MVHKKGDSEIIDSGKEGIARIKEKIQQTCAEVDIKINEVAIQLLNDKVNEIIDLLPWKWIN